MMLDIGNLNTALASAVGCSSTTSTPSSPSCSSRQPRTSSSDSAGVLAAILLSCPSGAPLAASPNAVDHPDLPLWASAACAECALAKDSSSSSGGALARMSNSDGLSDEQHAGESSIDQDGLIRVVLSPSVACAVPGVKLLVAPLSPSFALTIVGPARSSWSALTRVAKAASAYVAAPLARVGDELHTIVVTT